MDSAGKPDRPVEAVNEAEAIIRSARAKKEAIELEAYNEGMKKGQEEGRKMVVKKIEPLFDTLKKAVAELSDMRTSIIDTNREQILEIVFLIAEKVIHRRIQASPDIILDTVRAASDHLTETDEIRLRIHPSDYEYIREIETILSKKLSGKKNVLVMEDNTLDRGGVIIETEFGNIDASIKSQIEHLKETAFDHE